MARLHIRVPVPVVEFPDVAAFVVRKVGKDGRISGLGEYTGRDVYVVVPAGEKPPRKRASRAPRRKGEGS